MSAWIKHIKAFAARNNLSYACALSNPDCKKSYHAAKNVKESVPTGNPKLGMKGIEIKRPYVSPAAVKASKKVLTDPNLMAMIEGFRPKLSDNELSGLEDIFIELRYESSSKKGSAKYRYLEDTLKHSSNAFIPDCSSGRCSIT